MTDTSDPAFWDERYASQRTPWDFGGVPAELRNFLSQEPPAHVLIPGCGPGHEVRAFVEAGWRVDAVDFSAEAVRHARSLLGSAGQFIRQADFFASNLHAPFDVIYERTFLCALPLHLRPSYARQIANYLRPGGRLIGFFFIGEEADPPPHPLAPGELSELLGPAFLPLEDRHVQDSLPLFANRERWQVWQRATPAS